MADVKIKPLETVYNGYRFRSRLEARWAVFFDTLGIEYEYEKEGYDLGAVGWYLPDFWLVTVNMWAEVKAGNFSGLEKERCRQLAIQTDYPCLMLGGIPAVKPYWAMMPDWEEERDYALSNYSDYPQGEGRFYASCVDEDESNFREMFSDMEIAVSAARQARFERR